MADFMKSIQNPVEAIQVFNQRSQSFLNMWFWTEEIDEQQRWSFHSNPRILEFIQQYDASWS